jgi:2-keto-3-deoxy-L-rhamnonate aldolase RhmA
MRPNAIREKLASGGLTFGTMAFEFFTPGLPSVLAQAGAEWILLDMEHSGIGIETIKAQIAASRGTGLVPMVRVATCAQHLVAPVLDAGAMGVMAPMIETAEQAANLVRWCRYRPEGIRGLGFNLAHDDYGSGNVVTKMAQANARTLVIVQIETEQGVENADKIAAVPGVDVLWIGHFDLSDSMGITGQFDDPRFIKAVESVVAACRRHGKAPGVIATDPATARVWLDRGFRCFGYGTDIILLQSGYRAGLNELLKTQVKKSKTRENK